MRRPSRSSSVDQDVEQLMKVNTLLNSKSELKAPENNNSNVFDDSNEPTKDGYFPSVSSNWSDHNPNNHELSPISIPTSPSSADESKYTYTHPLVRKKSGELVKSSLKLNTLGVSSSLPSTPTYKQVHFGGADDVKFFRGADKPSSISANNSPFVSDDEDDYDSDEDYDQSSFYFDSNFQSGDVYAYYHTIYSASKEVVANKTRANVEKFKKLITGWNLDTNVFPKVSYRDEIDKETPVFLERCFLNVDKTELLGQIAVANIAFQKTVTVRYSFDDWKTVIDATTSYTPEIPRLLKKANYDRFVFKIDVPLLFSQFAGSHRHSIGHDPYFGMCIRYVANSQEFWDNNYHQNYTLAFYREPKHELQQRRQSSRSTAHNSLNRKQPKSPSNSYSSTFLRKTKSFEDATLAGVSAALSDQIDSSAKLPSSASSETTLHDFSSSDKAQTNSINSPGSPLILKDSFATPTFTDLIPPSAVTSHQKGKNSNDLLYAYQQNRDETSTTIPADENESSDTAPNESGINSKQYQEMLKKYCFFQSPSTVSSFLENDPSDKPPLNNYGHSFY
ncbi:carbohydrate-binding module family 21 protein [[Candida] arabinofermentans NRRL YB-2248]|uniref:Carbohydrate-binding module family 21 protein n=1 Tax=[Candida] arabinofermentans NRRL YB-2248 TaxID=983967 RepID=A0A1E4T1K4_9ASCO|nr:carbohydrate-binding module family 21 protein [[Candida] arabinofermentans NRRL YB-2248]